MKKGQTSKRANIQDILCPFTDMVITQGSGYADGNFSHQGTRAVDVRGAEAGIKYPYYAPFDCVCVAVYPDYGESDWQSVEKVRFADGSIDYCTFTICHDDTMNAYVGMKIGQGIQIGNMGTKGYATGVHCHIEFAKGKQRLIKNQYGIYGLTNAVEIEQACFMDNTNIIVGVANWKYLKDVPVSNNKYLNISPEADYRTVYKSKTLTPENAVAKLNPKKYGGLSYLILKEYDNSVVKIKTDMFGEVYISSKREYYGTVDNKPKYKYGNY